MGNAAIEMHAIARGRVQGVGFRATVQHHGQALGLVGTVKNLPDGSVELYAQGPQDKLDALIERIQSDNGFADVSAVTVDSGPARHEFSGFTILF